METTTNSKEMQKTWDVCLLNGWRNNSAVGRVIHNFIILENPSLLAVPEEERYAWFHSQSLKRCPIGYDCKMSVKTFIGKHSLKLSEYLFDGKNIDDTLKVIDSFKWSIGIDRQLPKENKHKGGVRGPSKKVTYKILAREHTSTNRIFNSR